jgi:dolichol-phosphate mannosyltransferase
LRLEEDEWIDQVLPWRSHAVRNIIIPTLNEEQNIGPLIDAIYDNLGPKGVTVTVVDDNSSDGTQDIVRGRAQKWNGVKLVVRHNKQGLSSAVRRGATEILEGPVVVMDADFSHHPRHLQRMFAAIEQGYDVVVGSRYVPRGATIGWSGGRVAVSKVATLIARVLLLAPVRDPMSGYVGCRSPEILIQGSRHANYKFLLEMLVTNRKLRTSEIPIVFRDRRRGQSKLGGTTIALFLGLVLRLLFQGITRLNKRQTPR